MDVCDPVILSYGDSIIRQSDLNILQSSCAWFTDNIISFYFEYCQLDKFSGSEICFVGPEVTQCIKLMPAEDLCLVLDPLNLRDKRAAFFAVNSNQDASRAGGTHWSLLFCDIITNQVFHFDSSRGFNASEANNLSYKISQYLRPKSMQKIIAKEWPVCQQSNGHDCGLHTIVNLDRLADQYADMANDSDIVNDSLNQPVPNSMRENLYDLVIKLKQSQL